jgi:hypothetical protein
MRKLSKKMTTTAAALPTGAPLEIFTEEQPKQLEEACSSPVQPYIQFAVTA